MRGRMGRPGLIGTMARTAVIAGTATAVSGGVRSRQDANGQQQQQAQMVGEQQQAQEQAAMQAQAAQQQTMQAQAAQQQQQAPAADDVITQLTKLGELKSAGVLDDEEFAAAKAKILGM